MNFAQCLGLEDVIIPNTNDKEVTVVKQSLKKRMEDMNVSTTRRSSATLNNYTDGCSVKRIRRGYES